MNLLSLSPIASSVRPSRILAAGACLAAPLAMSQTLTSSTPVMLNQACPSCSVLGVDLFLDPAGNVFADWGSKEPSGEGTVRTVTARFSPVTGKWGASPIPLPKEDSTPQIGYDGKGNAVAIWDTFSEGVDTYYYAYYSAEQKSWSRGVQFWENDQSGALLKVGPSGDAIVEGYARSGQVLFHFDPATRTMREVDAGNINTDFALDRFGNAIHLAVDRAWSAPLAQHVFVKRFDAATKQWTGEVQLTPRRERTDGLTTTEPRVVMDKNGNGMGLYTYSDDVYGVVPQMASVRYLKRTGRFVVKPIPVTGNGPVYGATMATDVASNVYATWSQAIGRSKSNIVFAQYSSTTGKWSVPRVIQTGNSLAWNPKIASDDKGNIVVAWIQQNSAGRYVQTAARYSAVSNTWGKPIIVQKNTSVSSYGTRIVMDNHGRATMVWLQEGEPTINRNPSFKLMASQLRF